MRITAVLTSHNRCELTLACLCSFYSQRVHSSVVLDSVLVVDGSTDATELEVSRAFASTKIVRGSGSLYWAGGMALAERTALSSDPDYLLWLNDDVALDQDAVARLLRTERSNEAGPRIVVGAVRDPSTGEVTYSGLRRRDFHPLRVEIVKPTAEPRVVEMFHGNVVLVPRAAFVAIGPIDGRFSHAHADLDYGLRAGRVGVVSILAPGTVGTCTGDDYPAPWLDKSLPVRHRLRLLLGRKGVPPRSAARYLKRHGGPLWPVFWIATYVRAVPSLLRPAPLGRTRHR